MNIQLRHNRRIRVCLQAIAACSSGMIGMVWMVGTLASLLLAPSLAAEPMFRDQAIFPPDAKHAHSSSIVQCPDGSLLACWYYGSGERKAADVVIKGSRLRPGATSWSDVFLMADTPQFPDCNPVLFIDRRERLWMFWAVVLAERWECSQLKYLRADDPHGNGCPDWTWQDAIQLKPGLSFPKTMKQRFEELQVDSRMWAEYAKPYHRSLLSAAADPYKRQTGWMPRVHPLTLPSGRILLPLYSDGFNVSLAAMSDDDGKTWSASQPIVGRGPIQPSIVRRRDGTVVAFCRDSGDLPARVLQSTSSDNGQSWSAAVDTQLPNPGSSLEVITLADGRWLFVGNLTERGRTRLTAALSDDEGRTWKWRREMAPRSTAAPIGEAPQKPRPTKSRPKTPSAPSAPTSKAGQFDYPSVLQSRDGHIHVTYSSSTKSGRSIHHAKFNLDWLTTGQEQR